MVFEVYLYQVSKRRMCLCKRYIDLKCRGISSHNSHSGHKLPQRLSHRTSRLDFGQERKVPWATADSLLSFNLNSQVSHYSSDKGTIEHSLIRAGHHRCHRYPPHIIHYVQSPSTVTTYQYSISSNITRITFSCQKENYSPIRMG